MQADGADRGTATPASPTTTGGRTASGGRPLLRTAGRVVGTARSVAVEGFWLAAHLAAYPVGALGDRVLRDDRAGVDPSRSRLDDLSVAERTFVATDVEATAHPVVLVHGLVDNRSAFVVLARGLRRRGFGQVVTYEYGPRTADLRVAATDLGRWVDDLLGRTGGGRVHLVGHSLGGLVARYWVQRLGGWSRTATLVTLGAPHRGTRAAHLLPSALGRQLRPGSDLVRELDEPADPAPYGPGGTRVVAVWSGVDQVVRPSTSARLEHPALSATDLEVGGVGHWSLPMDRRVVQLVATSLLAPHPQGSGERG